MRVILTHEQADFDAVASQLGAWLLDREAVPVVPIRINRNVRAFLTLYGAELPFVERRDLPGAPIESAILVDTQTMTTLKGMAPDLAVHIVDHHNLRPGLPETWKVRVEPVGATTTLLVEFLLERGRPLSRIEATLLLMGIYEDTGSLTYTRTTPRDLQASAALLERGASLEIVRDFLNHPLTLAQQALLDQLEDAAELHEIQGNSLLVACGDATGIDEELSTIAHKLRDMLDPDALVLLIRIAGGVQFIGRSTSDRVDVGGLAERFGGGGHHRAAAAMIKSDDLVEVQRRVVAALPDFVRPALQVAQIMSRGGPQVLGPDTPVLEAQERMQRYGYEGYPVVENGRVIGLLTRRSVDRAVAHRLTASAREVMEAGEVTVHPDDPVDHLQRVMTDSGWGQIPVVERRGGRILGIVTRTDLLKTLSPQPAVPGHFNYSGQLEKALPDARLQLLRLVAAEAHQQQSALYMVGGFVRDLLLEQPGLDFDLVVEGDAIALARSLAARHGGRVTVHRRFGTAKWHLERQDLDLESIDLVTARTEFYTYPSALPTVERGSIKLDLHRRDFTLNTLALRLDGPYYGDLHDYWGGLNDLRQGVIRVLHSLSFIDDPTRMLRAVRFEQRLGFTIEPRTMELLEAALGLLPRVSGDRIRHEIEYIFAEPNAAAMLGRLDAIGLLAAIHPLLSWTPEAGERMFPSRHPEGYWDLGEDCRGVPFEIAQGYVSWLMALPAANAAKITRRLKMRRPLETIVLDACRLWADLSGLAGMPPSRITARLDEADLFAVYCVRNAAPAEAADRIDRYAREWRHIRPKADGHTLRARGLLPGPAYKTILSRLREAWLDGEISSEAEEKNVLEAMLRAESLGAGVESPDKG